MAFSEKSVAFDGSNDYVTMGDVLGFEYTDAFSISFWAKTVAAGDWFISKLDGSLRGYGMTVATLGEFRFFLYTTSVNSVSVKTEKTINDGHWHHLTATYSGSGTAAGVTLYVDGYAVSTVITDDDLLGGTIITAAEFNISGRTNGAAGILLGNVDETSVYNAELSAAEVLAIFNGGNPIDLESLPSASKLVSWWRMGEGDTYPTLIDQIAGTITFPTIPDAGGRIVDYSPLTTCLDLNNDTRNECVNFPFNAAFDFERTDPFSGGVWIKTTEASTQILIGKRPLGPLQGYYLIMTSAAVSMNLTDAFGTITRSWNHSGALNDGNWHLVSWAYDGSNTSGSPPVGGGVGMQLFVDGQEVSSGVSGGGLGATTKSTTPLRVGRDSHDVVQSFIGKVAHSAVWNVELSAADMLALYGGGVPQDLSLLAHAANLVHWCTLGDGCATGAGNCPDLSTLNNDGTTLNVEPGDFVTDVPTGPETRVYNDGTMTNMLASNVQVPVPWSNFSQYSYYFDGVAEYATMGNVLGFEYTDSFSISCWVQTTATGGYFVSKMDTTNYRGYGLAMNSSGVVDTHIRNDNSPQNEIHVETTTSGLNDGEWHHLVLTWSGSATPVAADVTLYVDGVEETPVVQQDNLSGTIQTAASFNLSGINNGSGLRAGYLTDVAIYDRELSGAEVVWIYNGGEPRDLRIPEAPGDLTAYWRLGEAGESPRSAWGHKVQQWKWDATATKESTTITDASRLDSPGTLYNMEASNVTADTPGGISNYSCTFNGVDENLYSNVASTVYAAYNLQNGSVFSFAGWVKAAGGPGVVSGWLWGNGSNSLLNWAGYGLYLNAGKPKFVFTNNYVSSTRGLIVEATSATVDDGGWHHVVVCQRKIAANNHVVEIYIDGVSVATTLLRNDLGNNSVSGQGWSVGARNLGLHEPVAALCDEVSVWTKYLTQADVTALYNGGAPTDLRDHKPTRSFLRGWWRMGDAYLYPGTTVNMEEYRKSGCAPGVPTYSIRSVYFDSSNDHVVVPDDPALDFDITDPFSVSTWVMPWGFSAFRGLVAKGTSGAHWKIEYYGNFFYYPAGQIRIILDGSTAGLMEVYIGGFAYPLPFSEWFHLVVTYDGSNDATNIKAYINGEEWPVYVRYNTAMAGTMINTSPLWIGRATSYLGGFQDEVSIWAKELTQADVTEIWNGGDPADLLNHTSVADLAGWWRMGEGPGNDGTMVNMDAGDIEDDAPFGLLTESQDVFPDPVMVRDEGTSDGRTVQIPLGVGEGGIQFRYKMRGQDSIPAPPAPPKYVTWTADYPDFLGAESGSSVPPISGVLVPGSVREISKWRTD
jgi:hypothetical protein